MAVPMDPTSAAFLFAENRQMPMHVGGLQLFEKPEGAPRDYVRRDLRADVRGRRDRAAVPQAARPAASPPPASGPGPRTTTSTSSTTSGTAPCPSPGRVRELLDLCSRLHSTRLARERPLWEAHLIEGLRDGRVALYTKLHHSLVDGISAMRLLQSVMTHRPRQARHARRCGRRGPARRPRRPSDEAEHSLAAVPLDAMRTALGITADAAGLPGCPGQDAQARPEERDLGALALRAAHDVQHHDHRLTPLRRPGLADRAAAGDRQGERHHPERRRAGDVLRRDPRPT